ncbi:MAG: hypothetical protein U5K56_13290 [Halioglobus sp.]|nr:hypothetical protein [Halioglobus sp.]
MEGSDSREKPSDESSVDLRGALNLPLLDDTLGLRLAGVYADADGFVEVANPVAAEDSTWPARNTRPCVRACSGVSMTGPT